MYQVKIEKKVKKSLKKLSISDYNAVKKTILNLANEPRPFGYEKLKGRDGYRIRQGNYRILYDIEDSIKIVEIIKVAHRREVYK